MYTAEAGIEVIIEGFCTISQGMGRFYRKKQPPYTFQFLASTQFRWSGRVWHDRVFMIKYQDKSFIYKSTMYIFLSYAPSSSETHGWFRLLLITRVISSRRNQPWVSDDDAPCAYRYMYYKKNIRKEEKCTRLILKFSKNPCCDISIEVVILNELEPS